jgi:hypothetical protein
MLGWAREPRPCGRMAVLLVSTVSAAECLTHDLCRESDTGA